MIYVLSIFGLVLGFTVGWLCNEKYTALMQREAHDFDELFEMNPHPEIYKPNGEIYRGEYVNISFDLGYNPDEFEPDDIVGP